MLRGTAIALRDVDDILPLFPASTEMILGFSGTQDRPDLAPAGLGADVEYSYEGTFHRGNELRSRRGRVAFSLSGAPVTVEVEGDQDYGRHLEIAHYSATAQHSMIVGNLTNVSTWRGSAPTPEVRSAVQDVLETPRSVLENAQLVPAARGLGRPSYLLRERIEPIGFGSGLGIQEELLTSNLGLSRGLEQNLSNWLREITGVGMEVHPVEGRQLAPLAVTELGSVGMVSEGFGTNSLLLLLYQLAIAERNATIMIEEPEIHLHPRAQADLASLLVTVSFSQTKQVLMTTHSEHLLSRLLTLVAERTLTPDDISIYSFQKDDEGVCHATELEVSADGRVRGGIPGFFEANIEELDRFVQALRETE